MLGGSKGIETIERNILKPQIMSFVERLSLYLEVSTIGDVSVLFNIANTPILALPLSTSCAVLKRH